MDADSVAAMLVEQDAVRTGSFQLSSGQRSDLYINVKTLYESREQSKVLAGALHRLLPNDVDRVAAEGYGGLPLAAALRDFHDYEITLVRDTEKDYGLEEQVEHPPRPGDTVAVVDDVWTTGQSARAVKHVLDEYDVDFAGFYTVVYRGDEPVSSQVSFLTGLEEIRRYL